MTEYSTKESSTSPTFLALKVPLEVLHDSGTALFTTGMYLLDPFSKKGGSPFNPVSRRTLIALCLTKSLSLVSSGGHWASFRRVLVQFRPNLFNLDPNLVFSALFLALAFGKLPLVSPKICIIATTAVTLPVLEFSRAFSSALLLFKTGSATLIGRDYVDCKSDKNSSSNLRRLSLLTLCHGAEFPIPSLNHYWTSLRAMLALLVLHSLLELFLD